MLGYFFDELEYRNRVNQIQDSPFIELEYGQGHSKEHFASFPQKAVHDPQCRLSQKEGKGAHLN